RHQALRAEGGAGRDRWIGAAGSGADGRLDPSLGLDPGRARRPGRGADPGPAHGPGSLARVVAQPGFARLAARRLKALRRPRSATATATVITAFRRNRWASLTGDRRRTGVTRGAGAAISSILPA